ncbi:LOW QUALITY PROTEIN: uncharacterized protein ACIBXB_007777 [Morphnus guianensis]
MLRVRAVVMTRDDSSGGWVPTGGGGLSHVTVTRRREDGHRHRQYLIRGERLRDQAPTLECALRRDLEYNEVTPTFHHWRVGGSRFGLTFQSPADASAFRRGVRGALQALATGGHPWDPPLGGGHTQDTWGAGGLGDSGGHGGLRGAGGLGDTPPPAPPTIVTSESSASGYWPMGGQPRPADATPCPGRPVTSRPPLPPPRAGPARSGALCAHVPLRGAFPSSLPAPRPRPSPRLPRQAIGRGAVLPRRRRPAAVKRGGRRRCRGFPPHFPPPSHRVVLPPISVVAPELPLGGATVPPGPLALGACSPPLGPPLLPLSPMGPLAAAWPPGGKVSPGPPTPPPPGQHIWPGPQVGVVGAPPSPLIPPGAVGRGLPHQHGGAWGQPGGAGAGSDWTLPISGGLWGGGPDPSPTSACMGGVRGGHMLRVRAVVMTRDDSSGGWVPTGGGGLSHVTITRRREDGHRHRQYLIWGERLRDQAPTLECALRRDLEYNEVTPTFHHWRVGGSRFGLTFQSPADASAFRRGVRGALQALAAGGGGQVPVQGAGFQFGVLLVGCPSLGVLVGVPGPSLGCWCLGSQFGVLVFGVSVWGRPFWGPSWGCSPLPPPPATLWGPLALLFGGCCLLTPCPPAQPQLLLLGEAKEQPETPPPRRDPRGAHSYEDYHCAGGATAGMLPARVRFQKDPKGSPSCRIHGPSPPGAPSRCVYCRGVFSREENGREQCRDAPDPAGRCVRRLSCLWCAESLLYHCMADAEGDFSAPCSCGGHPHCCARWLAPAALALLVPCLCCYPLRACHWCGGHCGCCGGRHKATR